MPLGPEGALSAAGAAEFGCILSGRLWFYLPPGPPGGIRGLGPGRGMGGTEGSFTILSGISFVK